MKLTYKHTKYAAYTGYITQAIVNNLPALLFAMFNTKFGIPLEKAVTAATLTPARAIRKDDTIGSLEPGKLADFLILDKDLNLEAVYIGGKKFEG